jgi:hypothetical protein
LGFGHQKINTRKPAPELVLEASKNDADILICGKKKPIDPQS